MAATASAKRVGILVEFNYEDLEVGPRVPLAIDCMATVDAERKHRSLVTKNVIDDHQYYACTYTVEY